jgi:Alginate export
LESIDLGIEFQAHTTTAKRWPVSRWPPRTELQLDVASGTDNPNGDTLGTFNPLFPSGFYEMLAGYPGYANFVRLRSSAPPATAAPTRALTARSDLMHGHEYERHNRSYDKGIAIMLVRFLVCRRGRVGG